MSLTYHQILELGKRMETRNYHLRVARADETRVAQASKKDYESWRNSINPELARPRETSNDSSLEETVTLEGMSVQEN